MLRSDGLNQECNEFCSYSMKKSNLGYSFLYNSPNLHYKVTKDFFLTAVCLSVRERRISNYSAPRQTQNMYIVMMIKEESTKIVNCFLMIGRVHNKRIISFQNFLLYFQA